MAKHVYPISENYVSDWTAAHAIRELVANGLDAETELGAAFTATHKDDVLTLVNKGIKLDPRALYLGESTKRGGSNTIGQYGEGLKLALLVLARQGYSVTIRNGTSETWKATIEPDKNGVRVLVVHVVKANRQSDNLEVEVSGVSEELWTELRSWFLKLQPPATVHQTAAGELLDDPDYMGRIYVRGVYTTKRQGYDFGYNFKNLDTGRDRRIPNSWTLDAAIADMWNEVARRDDAAMQGRLYKAFKNESAEKDVFQYTNPLQLVEKLVAEFVAEYGEKAVPVTGISEGSELAHLGHVAVPLPPRLVYLLRQKMKSVEQVKQEYTQSVKTRWTLEDLTQEERNVVKSVLIVLGGLVPDCETRLNIVTFAMNEVDGLHKDQDVLLARHVLKDFGHALIVAIHEFAHDKGPDGSAEHVGAIQDLTAKVFNQLANRVRQGQELRTSA